MAIDEDFTDYVSARWPTLVRAARYLGCAHADAEDLVQSTLVRAYRNWSKVSRARDPDAYVYRILLNHHAKQRRRRWTKEYPTAEEGLPPGLIPDQAGRISSRVTLGNALKALPDEQRTVLVLRYYADLSEHQVASVLEVPVGTVKSRAHRGLERLGTVLDQSNV